MNKIRIGADELILWLRKNKKAPNVPNDGIQGLGLRIHDLIVTQLGGQKIIDNHPSYWGKAGNIGQFHLPQTSAQYEIDSNKLKQLYDELSGW